MCAHYGWSWQYLLWGIRWPIMQRILIDAPGYESAGEAEKEKELPLTAQTAEAILKHLE